MCNECRSEISTGLWFKSLTREDFDLCGQCEATGVHPEPMIRFRGPSPIPPVLLNENVTAVKHVFEEDKNLADEVIDYFRKLFNML